MNKFYIAVATIILVAYNILLVNLTNKYNDVVTEYNTLLNLYENMEPQIIFEPCNETRDETGSYVDSTPSFLKEIYNPREWVANKYDCTQFTEDGILALRRAGWSVDHIEGYYYPYGDNCTEESYKEFDCRHAWGVLKVPIEFTTNSIIEPEDYLKHYSKWER